MFSPMRFTVAVGLLLASLSPTIAKGEMTAIEPQLVMPPEQLEHPGGSADRWYLFQPESDGILTFLTCNSAGDLVLQVHLDRINGPSISIDGDDGHNGNEAAIFHVEEGRLYYIKVRPYSGGSLPAYTTLIGFTPEATLTTPFFIIPVIPTQ